MNTQVARSLTLTAMCSEEDAENYMKRALWGYPDLWRRFLDDVRPVLIEARDNKKAQNETGEQEDRDPGHIGTDPPHPTSDVKDESIIHIPTVHRYTPLYPPGATPDSLHGTVTEMDVLQDSQAQPDEHLPRPPFIPVGNTEEPGPMSRGPSPQVVVPGEEGQQGASEIKEN